MLLKWFNADEAVGVGAELADQFVSQTASAAAKREKRKSSGSSNQEIQRFLQRVDRDVGSLRLNLYRRAKLANSFKWKLRESGVEQDVADELTRLLLLRLSASPTVAVSGDSAGGKTRKRPQPHKPDSLLAQGDQHLAKGAYLEAVDCYEELLRLNPRHATTRNNLGAALCKLGRYEEAERQFQRAITLKPNYPDALCNLGTVRRWRGRMIEAETSLRRAVKLAPKYAEAHASLGVTSMLLGRSREARSFLEKALRIAPDHAGALLGMGQLEGTEGRFDEAKRLFDRALQVQPRMPGALAGLVRLRRMTSADAAWLETAESVATSGIAPLEEEDIRFAIGKYYDDLEEFGKAFRNYQRANELQKAVAQSYQRDVRTRFVDDMIRVYSRESLSSVSGVSDSRKPVFVVGMMRSGTSLVEQIISSHPKAAGAGELPFWNDVALEHASVIGHEILEESVRKQLAGRYLHVLAEHSSEASRVVDKATFNSDYLGIIHSVFPNARMVYVRRNPIDTCLSCYFQQFSAAHTFAMDLSDLAHYYRQHHRLMAHWRAVLPAGTLLQVPYEELVADQEKWTRKILEFIGLEWDARCLDFHRTERPVLTASFWQVKQKIYSGSIGRWRHYQKFIGPLLELKNLDS